MATYARATAHGAGSVATALRRLEHGQVLLQAQPMQALDRYAYAAVQRSVSAMLRQAAVHWRWPFGSSPTLGWLPGAAGLHPLEAEAHLEAAAQSGARCSRAIAKIVKASANPPSAGDDTPGDQVWVTLLTRTTGLQWSSALLRGRDRRSLMARASR